MIKHHKGLPIAIVLAGGTLFGTAAADEVQVNTYTLGHQTRPSVSTNSDGDFVVVWQSYGSAGSDDSYYSIQGQRYASDGSTSGGEFQVNTYTTGYQNYPAVAVSGDGDFVVVWESESSAGPDTSQSIQAQRYASDGSVHGSEFQVNSYTTSTQNSPAVAASDEGNFVVVWNSLGSAGSDSSSYSVQGQLYDSDGSPIGGEFQVNTYTSGNQRDPSVAMNATGSFVVTWESSGSGGADTSQSIQGQRYASDGSAAGGEFQVNSYTTDTQREPSVAMDASGGSVAVWESAGSGGSDSDAFSIQGRRFDSDGMPMGDDFQVNVYITSSQEFPEVAVDAGGNFVVLWGSLGAADDPSAFSVQGLRYTADGSPLGDEFQANAYTTSTQRFPVVGLSDAGNFVVAWNSDGSAGSDTVGYSIQHRIGVFFPDIFADGFETGDTTAWSATVGGGS